VFALQISGVVRHGVGHGELRGREKTGVVDQAVEQGVESGWHRREVGMGGSRVNAGGQAASGDFPLRQDLVVKIRLVMT
jgi:Na+/alanine symporter